jgi:hypothetical protein
MSHRPPFSSALSPIYYPPPPWLLHGSAMAASFAVAADAVAELVPEPLRLVTMWGGLAFGYLGVARYGLGSTLPYSELVAGVMVRHGSRFGPYVTHIGVDNETAQRAGRELWYLPKQLWQFAWELEQPERSVHVWDGARLVCRISGVPANARLLPIHTTVNFINMRGTDVATISGDFDLRMAHASWRLQLGPDGPLTALRPRGPLLTIVTKGVIDVHPLQVLED